MWQLKTTLKDRDIHSPLLFCYKKRLFLFSTNPTTQLNKESI